MWYSSTSRRGWAGLRSHLAGRKTGAGGDIGGGTTDCSLLLMGPQWRSVSIVKPACWVTVVAVLAVTIGYRTGV